MKHKVVITEKPERSGKESIPDGASTGNGDLSVILGNSENGMMVFIAKCDLWKANEHPDSDGGIKPLGYVDFDIPEKLYNNYYTEQRMDKGEIYCHFSDSENYADIKIIVCAVENDIYFEISSSSENLISKPYFTVFNCNADELKNEDYNGINISTRIFNNTELAFDCRVSSGIHEFSKNKYILSVATNFDSDTFENDVLSRLCEFNEEKYQIQKSKHYSWWKKFYSKSEFYVEDEQLELTNCYFAPLKDFMPKGRECAKKYLNCNGIFYPVGLLPKGLFSEYRENPNEYEKMFYPCEPHLQYTLNCKDCISVILRQIQQVFFC